MSGRWVAWAVFDWLVLAASIYLALHHIWFLPLAVLVIGSRQHALCLLGHDGGHRLIHKNTRLNDFLANVFVFWPLAVDMERYRQFHFGHHRNLFLGRLDQDPEIILKEECGTYRETDGPQFIRSMLGLNVKDVFLFMKLVGRISIPTAIMWLLALYVWPAGAAVFVVSLGTGFWAAFRLRVWTEHMGTTTTLPTVRPKLWQRALYLPHNTWCHAEHHAHPDVPLWALPWIWRRGFNE